MADQKISQLNNITGANVDDATDGLAIVDASENETKGITRGELFKSVSFADFDTGEIHGANIVGDFRTRAEAISNLSNIPTGAYFWVGVLLFQKVASSSVISDMPNVEPRGNVNLLHWKAVTTNNVSDNDQAIIQAIAWLNVGGRTLHLPPGNVTFNTTWPAITATGFSIFGPDTQIVINSGSSVGTLVVFGDASTIATNGRFIVAQCTTNQTVANQHYFRFDQTQRVRVETSINNANGIAKFGSSHGPARQSEFIGNGDFTRGATSNEAFLFEDARTITLTGIYNCAADCSSNANGAFVRMKPISGALIDTIKMVGLGFNSGTNAGADQNGKNYGLVIDMTDGAVTNISCDAFTFFDHTVLIAVHMFDTVAGNGYARAIHFGGTRIGSCYGKGVVLDKASGVSAVWGGIHLNDMDIFLNGSGNNEGVTIEGDGYLNCHVNAASIGDIGTAGTISRAILANSDGWVITGNSIGTNVNAVTDFAAGIEVSNADVVDIVISNNRCDPAISDQVKVPASWTTADVSSPRRLISWPGMETLNSISYKNVSGVTSLTSNTVAAGYDSIVKLNLSSPDNVSAITSSLDNLGQVTIWNVGSNTATIVHATGGLRTLTGANVSLTQHTAITFVRVSPGSVTWQQISGKT